MMIPLSASDISEFTPATLANVPAPPVFLFRAVTERDVQAYRRQLMIAGLSSYSPDEWRAAIKAELRNLWSEDAYADEIGRLENLWTTMDQNALLPEDERAEIPKDEWAAYQELMDRLQRSSQRLRQMSADDQAFQADAPKVAMGMFLAGWKNLDVSFRREAGMVPLETIDKLEAALRVTEALALQAKVHGVEHLGTAYLEVAAYSVTLINLTRDAEGNFEPRSASGTTPESSTQTASSEAQSKAGGSPASGRSKKTRAKG